jgi:hypothetical protein
MKWADMEYTSASPCPRKHLCLALALTRSFMGRIVCFHGMVGQAMTGFTEMI